ncbi:MAG TPA: hypothetical protein VK177_20310 [Flavobacteriales bacterium]|nr:hypothetical protein [Flavobacteriales bacterium]
MKKILFSLVLLAGLTSCKKVYQCECRRIVNGEDWNPIITNVAIEDQKKDAETTCQSLSYNFGWQDYQGCSIK